MSYRGRGRGGPNRGGGRGRGGRPPGLRGKEIGMYYRQQSITKKKEQERRDVLEQMSFDLALVSCFSLSP